MSDPGLTDLIAAHTTNWERRCLGGDESYLQCDCGDEFEDELSWAAHLKLVVEQHTNGRMTDLKSAIARVEKLAAELKREGREVLSLRVRAALEGEQQ